jgi:cell division protein ZapA (FtsZ GTPase activity inhibitor)
MTPKSAASGDAAITLDVSLLGRNYKVACKESERSDLLDAVALLDRRMREIRETGKIAGSERIAVMAALNIAHDLQRARKEARTPKGDPVAPKPDASAPHRPEPRVIDDASARRRITQMQSAIDQVLAGDEKLV